MLFCFPRSLHFWLLPCVSFPSLFGFRDRSTGRMNLLFLRFIDCFKPQFCLLFRSCCCCPVPVLFSGCCCHLLSACVPHQCRLFGVPFSHYCSQFAIVPCGTLILKESGISVFDTVFVGWTMRENLYARWYTYTFISFSYVCSQHWL